ncbi:ribonuclease H-like domain-containing protein [Tanacetum coccineum]
MQKPSWTAIKARFGVLNEASKKMQKNLLKQQFETFTIGSREELDSAYERFQNILSMLELYDAKVSLEDANLKFLRSLPSVWHVVATMIRGQPGLDELEFDDLYNNLKVTLKQSTVEPAHIPKGYTQAASSKEIDIRWQVGYDNARIGVMRKTGRPIDLKPKNGITFDKSKIECFNCQKLGHFARECRFAKYQENRANGRQEKRIVAIEDSNSKALVATDNNEDIDWTKEFDAEPVTLAMMALTEVEQDDWSMEFDAEHVHFGQDGLGDFDWSNKADDTPVSLALMATNSEEDLKDYAIIDSGCSGSMTGDKDKLSDFKEFKGGYMAFGNDSKERSQEKETFKTSCIDFEKVSYVEELKFNLLFVSQICDKKHNVLFTDKECLILSPTFKFVDEDLEELVLVAKAIKDEAVIWHRRLGHVNFKEFNKLVKGNLVRGSQERFKDCLHVKLSEESGEQRKGGQETACNDVEDFDDQQFIVHGPSINPVLNKRSEEHRRTKKVPFSLTNTAIHVATCEFDASENLLLNFIMMLKGMLLKRKRRE